MAPCCDFLMPHSSLCAIALGVARDRSIRTPTSLGSLRSTTQHRNHPEEDPLMRVPRQQPIQKTTTRSHDLAGQSHEGIDEGLELQAQYPRLLLAMPLLPAARFLRQAQRPAHHAFRFHANAVITMYAPLLSRLSSGARNARTPLCN